MAQSFLDEMLLMLVFGAGGIVVTNFDNLALLVALIPVIGRARALAAFWTAQGLVLILSLATAAGLSARIADPGPYVAILPISLGLWKLLGPASAQPQSRRAGSWFAALIMFLMLTGDTFSLFAPLMADSLPALRPMILLGAVSSALVLGLIAARLQTHARLAARIDRLAPWIMISIGVYIFLDSGTDLFQ